MNIAGLTILILEDEPLLAMTLEDILLEAEATPIVAYDVPMALDLLAENALDCAILDVNIKGGDSAPVARALAENGVPFIFATGYGESRDKGEFPDVQTVSKPYQLDAIVAVLAQEARSTR